MAKNDNIDENVDLMDLLLDDDYDEPIILFDENQNKVAFEKVAVINLSGMLYFILSPLDYIDGIGEDEALVFKFVENKKGEQLLTVEESEEVAMKVFDEYYRLLGKME